MQGERLGHKVLDEIRNPLFSDIYQVADREFQRHEMMDVAARIPGSSMEECSAIGTVDECVTSCSASSTPAPTRSYYGRTPGQNAELIAAWRDRAK